MATMKLASKSNKRRGKCKTQNFPPRIESGGEKVLPDVASVRPGILKEVLPILHSASFYKDLPAIQYLVESRPSSINERDSHGFRPIHMVLSYRGSLNTRTCLKYLLEHEADINVTTDAGQTPLHLAASQGHLDCAQILVKAGAEVLVKDNMGFTPLDMARIWGQREVARFLKNCEWKINKTRELEKRKQAQALYRDLVNTVKEKNLCKKKTEEKMVVWAKDKGLPLLKDFSPRVQVSKYHSQCLLPYQMTSKPKHLKCQPEGPERDRTTSTQQPEASFPSPWTIFMGLQPEYHLKDPDLRDTVTLWKDSSTQKLQYITKWEGVPHPTPDLPLDVMERVLFPRDFPSRIITLQDHEPMDIEKVPHRGCPQGRSTSFWTEVAMHLDEDLDTTECPFTEERPSTRTDD